MDLPEAKRIVNAHLSWLRWGLQLQSWHIDVVWSDLDFGIHGECRTLDRYRRATITIDARQIDDEEQLLRVLRHELLHVIHARIESYRAAVGELVAGDAFAALDVLYQDACESIVWHLEQMLDHGIKIDVEKRARQVEEKKDTKPAHKRKVAKRRKAVAK